MSGVGHLGYIAGLLDRRGNCFEGKPRLSLFISHFLSCFKTLRINVCYWPEKVPGSYGVSQAFPCFLGLDLRLAPHHIYGLPSDEYPGLMKVSERQREG